MAEYNARIKHKRDTDVNWADADPVLLNGEIIIVDTMDGHVRKKVGDGTQRYSHLPFDDEQLAGVVQSLTNTQKEQARANIGAGQPVFAVNVTGVGGSSGYTADKTAAEIEAAYQAGRTIVCKTQAQFLIGFIPVELPLVSRNQERVFVFAVDQLVGTGIFGITVTISDSGVEVSNDMVEIYEQPVGGIPKSDLADDVQTSLDKADAAVSLGLTAATPGQIIKVKTVQNGKPTEWEAVDDRLPKVTSSDAGNVLGVEQIGEHEYGYALTHMPTLSDFIPLGITNASPGQFAKVSFVDDFGGPTAWEAADIYEKPTSGIPKSDLEQSVQTSLDKVDTAISYNSQTLTEEQRAQARTNIGAGQPLFVVNVTTTLSEQGDEVYTADKTAAEIETAYQAGREIVCRMSVPIIGMGSVPVQLPLASRRGRQIFMFAINQTMWTDKSSRIVSYLVTIADDGVNVGQNNTEIYIKPASGIPKTDLEQSVQTSLNLASTALQAVPGIYRTAAAQDELDTAKQPKAITDVGGHFGENPTVESALQQLGGALILRTWTN